MLIDQLTITSVSDYALVSQLLDAWLATEQAFMDTRRSLICSHYLIVDMRIFTPGFKSFDARQAE